MLAAAQGAFARSRSMVITPRLVVTVSTLWPAAGTLVAGIPRPAGAPDPVASEFHRHDAVLAAAGGAAPGAGVPAPRVGWATGTPGKAPSTATAAAAMPIVRGCGRSPLSAGPTGGFGRARRSSVA